MTGERRRGRPAKGGGRLNVRLGAHARSLLDRHTRGMAYEGEDGREVAVPASPSYPTMTSMVEHGIELASRRDLVPRLADDPAYQVSRQKIRDIIADLDRNIKIGLACFDKRYGRDRSRWHAPAVQHRRLLNSLIWTRGRLVITLAREVGQPAPEEVLKQLRALACEERYLRLRR